MSKLARIASRLSIRCISRVHAPDKRDPRQPRVVELCRRLVNICGSPEPADGDNTVGLAVVVPAIRAAYDKVDAKFVPKHSLPAAVGKFSPKIRMLPKETNVLKPVRSRGITGNQIG